MAEIVLFHSALGLRPGVTAAADRLRGAGHSVHVPDYYDGEVFDDLEDGLRKRDELGVAEILRRAREAVAGLPGGLVFAGFSLGNDPAELLAAERPGARGALLMHGGVPIEAFSEFGVERWPEGVPVQVHYAAEDPWVEAEEVAALGDAVRGAGASFEEHSYRRLGPSLRRPGPARVRSGVLGGDVAARPCLPRPRRRQTLSRHPTGRKSDWQDGWQSTLMQYSRKRSPKEDQMIGRIWHGWTKPDNANRYERLLKEEIFPGIADKKVPGYRGIQLFRRSIDEEEVEFITIMWFDSWEAVKRFTGEDYERAYVPSKAREVLARFDERSQHYEIRERLDY